MDNLTNKEVWKLGFDAIVANNFDEGKSAITELKGRLKSGDYDSEEYNNLAFYLDHLSMGLWNCKVMTIFKE